MEMELPDEGTGTRMSRGRGRSGVRMNEETGRAEGGGVTREKKEGKKRYDCRWGHIRANREETECERGGGGRDAAATAAAATAAATAAAEYTTRPSRVLGGSVCRVAWPIVCKGSRSSSKEPAEEEEEGSEAN